MLICSTGALVCTGMCEYARVLYCSGYIQIMMMMMMMIIIIIIIIMKAAVGTEQHVKSMYWL